jgi:UDP-GlcNAc:undecaprenyl-phosphate/decaprenyl-phosphate GlcNAc-1-phosphate transferase
MLIPEPAMWSLPFLSFCLSLAVSLMLTPILIASAGRLQFLDYPGGRKMHTSPIAKVGGVGFGVGVFLAIILLAPKDRAIMGFLLGGFTILLFGVWDDRVNLDYRIKFLGQFLAAALVLWFANGQLSLPAFQMDGVWPPWISMPVTLMFLIGVTNAFNLSDGLDGLAGGLALLSLGGMIYLAHESLDPALLVVLVAMAGGVLGFLRFNTFPARVFMGDGGSQFIGFSLGVTALMLFDPARGGYSLGIGLLILGLPILDTLQVMVRRVWNGASPFKADRNHLHHQLIAQGLTQDQAVILIYGLQGLLVGNALLLRWYPEWVGFASYVLSSTVILWFFLRGYGRSLSLLHHLKQFGQAHAKMVMPVGAAKRPEWSEWLLPGLDCMIPAFFLLGLLIPDTVPADCGILAVLLGIFLVAGKMVAERYSLFMVRIGLYTGAMLMLYLIEFSSPDHSTFWSYLLNGFFLLLALFVVWTIGFYRGRGFQLTTLDYLVVVAGVALPFMSGWTIAELHFGLFMAKMILIFFAFELVLTLRPERVGFFQQMLVVLFGLVGLSAWGSW